MKTKPSFRPSFLGDGSSPIVCEDWHGLLAADRNPSAGPSAPPRLGTAVVAGVRELVLQMGGVTEREAAILLRIMQSLADLETRSGTERALAALQDIRTIMLAIQ
jgi:hypothetical protein